jgi:SAM-dependent methyltransferase
MLWCYALTLFASATLLFSVQPMAAKMVLPLLGGTPAVWTACMVFFQAALLAGYAYSHWVPTRLGVRRHALLHLGLLLLPFLALPISLRGEAPPGATDPVEWLLVALAVTVGPAFFAVATSAPLLQRWFAGSSHAAARDPYFLYGASNLGSMVALLAYPIVIEPRLGLAEQTWVWTVGYGILVALTGACVVPVILRPERQDQNALAASEHALPRPGPAHGRTPSFATRLRWTALAFIPSSLVLGATIYITTDVAPIPLLWVIPLALYLFSFILAFARLPVFIQRGFILLFVLAVGTLAALQGFGVTLAVGEAVALHLTAMFAAAMVCHMELARTRPAVEYLTEFYLWIALGGVLGGVFNGIVAPHVFDRIVEYPLLFAAPCLLRPRVGPRRLEEALPRRARPRGWGSRGDRAVTAAWLLLGIVLAEVFYAGSLEVQQGFTLERRERSFFGVMRVQEADGYRYFSHGTTLHGAQSLDPKRRDEPLTYYSRSGPIGDVFQAFQGARAKQEVALVGLGTGSLACYADAGQKWTFFEIDPTVERIAADPRYFTFLHDAEGRGVDLHVVFGDARLQLARVETSYGLIVLDAFSSDSIPVHLLTREAVQLYLRKLAPGGILAFHVSNKYVMMPPVLAELARDAGLCCYFREHLNLSKAERAALHLRSTWVVMVRKPDDFGPLAHDPRWVRVAGSRAGARVWTDDYCNIIDSIIWDTQRTEKPTGR